MDDEKAIALEVDDFDGVLLDMDGVITRTAEVHKEAWKETFDRLLESLYGADYEPFDLERDYLRYVDGRPREDGIRTFLASRAIDLPSGETDSAKGLDSVSALGRLKNESFLKKIAARGVAVYKSSAAFIRELRKQGLKVGVITSSENGRMILESARLLHLFDVKVDGVDAGRLNLAGKPDPAILLEAASELEVEPSRICVIEDAGAGVKAGRAGGFGRVIGVDRGGNRDLLLEEGAHYVVEDLSQIKIEPSSSVPQAWLLSFEGFFKESEGNREALCALGNGYFCTRAASPHASADGTHYPGTYAAGIYNRLVTEIAGNKVRNEDLVNLPNWLPLTFRIEDGDWFSLTKAEIITYRQTLDLRRGVVERQYRFRDADGRETSVKENQFVHMRHFHLGGIRLFIEPLNWSGEVTVSTALDGTVENKGSKIYRHFKSKHLSCIERGIANDCLFLKVKTSQSHVEVAEASTTRVYLNSRGLDVERRDSVEPERVAQQFSVDLDRGDVLQVEKVVSLFTSRDDGISDPGEAAKEAVVNLPDFEILLDDQLEAWQHLWRDFNIKVETKEARWAASPSLVVHLHGFHVLQTASPNSIDIDMGIPARGWTGEAYQGHVFWDDIFVFPFLNWRRPEITRSLLKYRYRRLSEARRLASALGSRGARFPWQSGSNGCEETPRFYFSEAKEEWVPELTHMQIHVNAAIAYNIWHYYQVTADLEFLYTYGADVLLEIARFFASYAIYNPSRDRFEINGVIGPDEYHQGYYGSDRPGINNNAYTNLMAVWTICRALDLLDVLPEDHALELKERLDLTLDELEEWNEISRKMFVPLCEDGVICQFEGHDKLLDFPKDENGEIDRVKLREVLVSQGGNVNQYKLSKQADVLMLFYLLSEEELKHLFERLDYPYSDDMIVKNLDYYAPETADDSTLSRVVHAWVQSRVDSRHSFDILSTIGPDAGGLNREQERQKSWTVFLEALGSDFFDIQGGTTREGIHIGAMAGTADILLRCYTGIDSREDVLWLSPKLPSAVSSLSFNVHYRKQALNLEFRPGSVKVKAKRCRTDTISLGLNGKIFAIEAGKEYEFPLSPDVLITSYNESDDAEDKQS